MARRGRARQGKERFFKERIMALHPARLVENLVWLGLDDETIAIFVKEEIRCLQQQ